MCPNPFTETTRVDGNLIVEGNDERMGGGIHVFGPCNKGELRSELLMFCRGLQMMDFHIMSSIFTQSTCVTHIPSLTLLRTQGDCNADGYHSLLLDGGSFDVRSGGRVSISAADSNINNFQASELFLRSGDGTSKFGGSGGDILVLAGDGSGGEICFCSIEYSLTRA